MSSHPPYTLMLCTRLHPIPRCSPTNQHLPQLPPLLLLLLLQVFPFLLDGEGNTLANGICVNLTLPQTLDLLQNANWPGTLQVHTHDVGCSEALTLSLTWMNPPKHSWHGPNSFCAWWTGALAFVDGANDPYKSVRCRFAA
jgi:hypothetical protein